MSLFFEIVDDIRYICERKIVMGNKQSIAEIKAMLNEGAATAEEIDNYKMDPRKGVQAAVKQYDQKLAKEDELSAQFEQMMTYERKNYQLGKKLIAGIDEVGRGPLAGPVVAAAVILPEDIYLPGINDSKKMSKAMRETLYDKIKEHAICYSIGIIDNNEIDRINIYQATIKAMMQAVSKLSHAPDHVLIDAMSLPNVSFTTESIIKGDQKSISIAAASILAKVTRDKMMLDLHREFPNYYFNKNQGYGTKDHIKALEEYGITPIHRQSFAPIKRK